MQAEVEMMEDVISSIKRRMYAPKGERATVVATYGEVLIVETKKRERFPVRIEKVKFIRA